MKQKNIKVAYTSRIVSGSYTQVPKIQMEGKWLEELGFSIGSTMVVEYGEGSLHIHRHTKAPERPSGRLPETFPCSRVQSRIQLPIQEIFPLIPAHASVSV